MAIARAPDRARFERVEAWIFDLDHTLYPPSVGLLDRVDKRMTETIAETLSIELEEASSLRRAYWIEYGATLEGLTRSHGVERDAFLAAAHDVALDGLEACRRMRGALAALPGRLFVHTNGSRAHARRVLERLELADLFDAVFAIEDVGYTPKPAPAAFAAMRARAGVRAERAAMIEDTLGNLAEPAAADLATIWAREPGVAAQGDNRVRVDAATEDLPALLSWIATGSMSFASCDSGASESGSDA